MTWHAVDSESTTHVQPIYHGGVKVLVEVPNFDKQTLYGIVPLYDRLPQNLINSNRSKNIMTSVVIQPNNFCLFCGNPMMFLINRGKR